MGSRHKIILITLLFAGLFRGGVGHCSNDFKLPALTFDSVGSVESPSAHWLDSWLKMDEEERYALLDNKLRDLRVLMRMFTMVGPIIKNSKLTGDQILNGSTGQLLLDLYKGDPSPRIKKISLEFVETLSLFSTFSDSQPTTLPTSYMALISGAAQSPDGEIRSLALQTISYIGQQEMLSEVQHRELLALLAVGLSDGDISPQSRGQIFKVVGDNLQRAFKEKRIFSPEKINNWIQFYAAVRSFKSILFLPGLETLYFSVRTRAQFEQVSALVADVISDKSLFSQPTRTQVEFYKKWFKGSKAYNPEVAQALDELLQRSPELAKIKSTLKTIEAWDNSFDSNDKELQKSLIDHLFADSDSSNAVVRYLSREQMLKMATSYSAFMKNFRDLRPVLLQKLFEGLADADTSVGSFLVDELSKLRSSSYLNARETAALDSPVYDEMFRKLQRAPFEVQWSPIRTLLTGMAKGFKFPRRLSFLMGLAPQIFRSGADEYRWLFRYTTTDASAVQKVVAFVASPETPLQVRIDGMRYIREFIKHPDVFYFEPRAEVDQRILEKMMSQVLVWPNPLSSNEEIIFAEETKRTLDRFPSESRIRIGMKTQMLKSPPPWPLSFVQRCGEFFRNLGAYRYSHSDS